MWLTFTSPALRSLLVDWPTRAQDILARFRGDHGRHAGDPYFVQLVERLNSVSAEFALWWPRHDVRPQSEGRKQYNHPVTGPLLAEHLTFSMTDNPELRLTIFSPIAAGDSIAKFKRIIRLFRAGDRESNSTIPDREHPADASQLVRNDEKAGYLSPARAFREPTGVTTTATRRGARLLGVSVCCYVWA